MQNALKALSESQQKNDVIKAYAEETKRSLDILRKENGEQVLKIEELIREKIKIAQEFDNSAKYNQATMRPLRGNIQSENKNPEQTISRENGFVNEAPLMTPSFVHVKGYTSDRNENIKEIDDKLQGILKKCIFVNNEIYR